MRRYQLILGGTVAGIAGVLAFPTNRHGHLTIPSSGSTSTGSSATTGGTGSSSGGAGGSASAAGSTSSSSTPAAGGVSASSAARTATGTDVSFRFGDMAVTVTVSGAKITNVGMAQINETDGRSQAIDQYAVPQLEQQVLSANSANISGVSGATYSSQAFVDSLVSALNKLGFKG